MPIKSREIDRYIAKAQPFARPILTRVRATFHKACPDVREVLKWGHPSFDYKGILGGMASFKQHAVWGLWKSKLIDDPTGAMKSGDPGMMGGGKLTNVSQLPSQKVMIGLIKQAVALNEKGVKVSKRKSAKKPAPKIPSDLSAALRRNARAGKTWEGFSPSHKREYIEWIVEAKQAETRERRLLQAIEWMADGKPRNWKYMNCGK